MDLNQAFRLAAYWLTIAMGLWTMAFFFAYGTEDGQDWYRESLASKILPDRIRTSAGAFLIGVTSPLLVAASFAVLTITRTPLPVTRTSWVNKVFSQFRKHKDPSHKNQFFVGELNFDYLAIFLIIVPLFAYFWCNVDRRIFSSDRELTSARKLKTIANYFGFCGTFAMSFFLIPVARHSVLLSAMGWSPVHALRLHIWAGFAAFFLTFLHGLLYVINWFQNQEESVWHQVMPGKECWVARPEGRLSRDCRHQWYNFTGVFAGFFFIILCATSINWFRRRYYRLFYLCHVTFGSLMLLFALMHYTPVAYYVLPSVVYYFASTTPVLVQAVASRLRGGVKISKVLLLEDAGGCIEVQLATNPYANQALDEAPGSYIKLCVPQVSLVWHPFTVFKESSDPKTVRFLFRPVGPFTNNLAERFNAKERPIAILDGFYRGEDRVGQAMQHDHIVITAGGVAITPFLSMIPAILARAQDSQLRKITLIWAVRENGLFRHVYSEYLSKFVTQAREGNIQLEIQLYHTGSMPESIGLDSEVAEEAPMKQIVDGDSTQEGSDLDEKIVDGAVATVSPMEIARFMPGRFGHVHWNLPVFVAMGFLIWVCYWIVFDWYNNRNKLFNDIIVRLWGNLIALAVTLVFSIVVEIFIIKIGQHYWPKPKADKYLIQTVSGLEDITTNQVVQDVGESSVVQQTEGRPSPGDVLSHLREAKAPALYTCGPKAMVHGIVSEARKENSVLGLTRYCIYDEPFEM